MQTNTAYRWAILLFLIATLFLIGCGKESPTGAESQLLEEAPLALSSGPQFIESLATSRMRQDCGIDLSFVSGDNYSVARNILAAEGYTFGTGISTITANALAGVDIFVIGGKVAQALTATEKCVLEAFVNQGGAVLDPRNMFTPSIFGVKQIRFVIVGSGQRFINTLNPDVAQVIAGVTPLRSLMGARSILTTGSGIPFIEDLDTATPAGVIFPSTATRTGRAIIIGDEEIFMNTHGDCPGGPQILNPDNQQLLINIFAYLSQAPGLDEDGIAVIEEACKVTICHKDGTAAEMTLVVPPEAVDGHLGHGDTLGACNL